MKYLVALFLVLVFATAACALEINPPPLSLTPQSAQPTSSPVVPLPTLTFTSIPPSATLPSPTETMLPATSAPAEPTATTTNSALTIEQLRNSTLTVMNSDQILRTITLKDGIYQDGTDPAQPGYIKISMGDKIAFGDLNHDGLEDAVMSMAENYGGTGQIVSLVAILNQGGQPNPVATTWIDDRPMLNELTIKDGEIYLDATIHAPNDPACCPAMPSTRTYRLIENSLVLSRFSTKTPDGRERVIQIESPANGTEISGPFIIKGSISISPFENTLSYAVYLQSAPDPDPVEQAGFFVNADGLGGPGTFELALDLGKYGGKGPFRVVISDISAADGSYLDLSTVYLDLK